METCKNYLYHMSIMEFQSFDLLRDDLLRRGVDPARFIEVEGSIAWTCAVKLHNVPVDIAYLLEKVVDGLGGDVLALPIKDVDADGADNISDMTDMTMLGSVKIFEEFCSLAFEHPYPGLPNLAQDLRELLVYHTDQLRIPASEHSRTLASEHLRTSASEKKGLFANRGMPRSWEMPCRDRSLIFDGRPLVMGILNVTPDSFSDGGLYLNPEDALRHADRLIEKGADLIDIGAESTRPGYHEVTEEEEWSRLEPVLLPLLERCPVPVSVDTYKSYVAIRALDAGAHIINDIWGLQKDADMADVAAFFRVPVILGHNQSKIRTYDSDQDLMDDILAFLERSIDLAVEKGLPEEMIVVDPGIGFGKTVEQNLGILRNLSGLRSLCCPILLGVSRKSVIRKTLDSPEKGLASSYETLAPTIALNVLGLAGGASIFRVHDVAENKLALRMAHAVLCQND